MVTIVVMALQTRWWHRFAWSSIVVLVVWCAGPFHGSSHAETAGSAGSITIAHARELTGPDHPATSHDVGCGTGPLGACMPERGWFGGIVALGALGLLMLGRRASHVRRWRRFFVAPGTARAVARRGLFAPSLASLCVSLT